MFIYLKSFGAPKGCRYEIKKIKIDAGFYFEISFAKKPTSAMVGRAVKRCSRKKALPIISDGVPVPRNLYHRVLSDISFTRALTANAFARVASGNSAALVLDPDGIFSSHLIPTLSRVGSLFVVTNRPDLYEKNEDNSLSTTGNSAIILKHKPSHFFDAVLCADQSAALCRIRLGECGFLPSGNTVFYKGKEESRTLMSAIFCCTSGAYASDCVPVELSKGNSIIRLDNNMKVYNYSN